MTAFSSSQPEAVALMRKSLKELYGLQGTLFDQYIVFWKRILVGRNSSSQTNPQRRSTSSCRKVS
jgi:hypothetical protein